jgi:Fur family transcriptional regulator, ferric uptake regulator
MGTSATTTKPVAAERSARPGAAEVHRMARERLMDRDQRYTTGRRRLVEVLAGTGAPVTLPALLALAPDLSQSSAYRNLALMEEAGVVRRLVHGAEHAHYELAEDLTEHHHHLICEECGLITDITLDAALERSLDRAFDGLAEAAGFSPRHHALDVFGRCAKCAAAA